MTIEIIVKIDGQEVLNEVKDIDKKGTDVTNVSQYARYFNETCPAWTNDSEYNFMYLKIQQQYANDRLRVRGYLFLNDVYEMLGMPRTKAGQVVGWVYNEKNPRGDNYIDFGLYNLGNENFVNGYERSILLDFNVDGNILDKLEEG